MPRVLDVGCGGNPSFSRATSIDRSSNDIRGRPADVGVDIRRPQNLFVKKFQIADARELPFPDKSFDIGLYSHILEHMPTMLDLAKVLKEAKRVCHNIHVWLPSVVEWGFTNKDHHLMWMKGLRPFPGLLRRLIWLAYFLGSNRFLRSAFKHGMRHFGVREERHLTLNMDELSLDELKRIFQGNSMNHL